MDTTFPDSWDNDDLFWDTFYDMENLLDYWQDNRIDHTLVSYYEWANMVIFL